MAERTTPEAATIQMVAQDQTEGYCDPITGACVWPGAAQADTDADKPAEVATTK
jgi:hypothetical protein